MSLPNAQQTARRMIIYWLMLALPLLATLAPGNVAREVKVVALVTTFIALVLIIGLRDGIGCDWGSYLDYYFLAQYDTLAQATARTEIGYGFLNWFSAQLGLGVYAVNVACAAIFSFGLLAFCRRQPAPALALAVAIPYMVIVVAMGYTRQAAALGVIMLAFNAFADNRPRMFLALIAGAALFHTSSVALAPMVVFMRSGKQLSRRTVTAIAAGSLVFLVSIEALDAYIYSYVTREYEGEGVFYRLPISITAALVFLIFRRRWKDRYTDNALNGTFALMALALIPVVFISTVIADRVGLYLLPFQAAVFSRVPHSLGRSIYGAPAVLALGAGLCAMLYVWLRFANHAGCWVPYNSVLF